MPHLIVWFVVVLCTTLAFQVHRQVFPRIMRRNVCFENNVASAWFTDVADKRRLKPSSWALDNLHSGANIYGRSMNLTVLSRSTNYVCIVKDNDKNKIFSVRAANLPEQGAGVAWSAKMDTLATWLYILDENRVRDVTIRFPQSENAPWTFDARLGTTERDESHPYCIISYNDDSDCLAFACTSSAWSPHITPMKLAILDRNFGCSENNSVWTHSLRYATAIDASRCASFPAEELPLHFQASRSTAKSPANVVSAIKHIMLCHVRLNGQPDEDRDPTGELDIGSHSEELDELDLVIGSFQVDESLDKTVAAIKTTTTPVGTSSKADTPVSSPDDKDKRKRKRTAKAEEAAQDQQGHSSSSA